MHDIRKLNVMENVMDENDHIAEHVREHMGAHGVLIVNEMGAPGVGKTTTLKNIIERLQIAKPFVIEGDIESDLDTKDLNSLGIAAYQINTFGACHLDAPMIDHKIDEMDFDLEDKERGILFIENIGNLVCPGSDKPYKYPLAFEKADIILINKVDLIPYLDFDEEFFMKGVRALNKTAPVFKVSGKTGEGYAEVAAWLEGRAAALDIHEHHHGHGDDEHHHHHHE